ncbi:hypothetical protein [Lutibacter sp.]|uniref:hypothetical protein n=1 Tax=Lutibacter sp. TaxID=1925666 RepID=UPI001A2BDB1D|nr:hypothetical protein [Lutibacter sp.]MBI9042787.1 hypothetical protein [Lutibacter sp.]
MNENKILEELKQVLLNDPDNFGKISELSAKLASFDENDVRFSIDAGVIDRLGN